MKTLPFLFSGTAAFSPQAAADLVMTQTGNETLNTTLGGLQTYGELPPSLGSAILEFQTAPDQDGEARLSLAEAILDTPPHQWRRVTLPQERRQSQLEYLRDVSERLAHFASSAGTAANPEEMRLMRSLEGGLNAFAGSEFLHGDAGQVDLFCRRVAKTLQNAALQTMAELADGAWPSLATFLESAKTEGYLSFSYHPRAKQPLDHENEEKIQLLAAQIQKNGITWPYRFVDWTRSLYLTGGDLENGHKRAAMAAFSKSINTLLKTQPLTEADLRKQLGGISLTLGLPFANLPENWPNDLPTTIAKWLIQIWDASQEGRDWRDLEACANSWTACWRNSETKENKDVIRYELERWLNNAANSVTWRHTGDVAARLEELEKTLIQVDQDSLEILRGTRSPNPLRAPWRAPRRTISGTVPIPDGFHFAGRLRTEETPAAPSPQEEAPADEAKPIRSVVDESVFSAIPTLTPDALSRHAPLIPMLDAAWLSSVMAADAGQTSMTPASEAGPEAAALPPHDEASEETTTVMTPEEQIHRIEPLPMMATSPEALESAPEVSPAVENSKESERLWTSEMRSFIKRNNLTRYESAHGGYQDFAIPRGRQDFIQVAGKNWRGPNQKAIAEAVQACAEGSPHYERVRELMKPLFNGNIQARPTQRALEGFLEAVALLVHPDRFADAPSTETSMEAWAKAISPFVINEGESIPGWGLMRNAIVDALKSNDATRTDAERLERALGARVPELLLEIVQKNESLHLGGRWLALMRLQMASATGNEPALSDAQIVIDLMVEIARSIDQTDMAAMSDPQQLNKLSEETSSGLALCRDFLSRLLEEGHERLEILFETEETFRNLAEEAEWALLTLDEAPPHSSEIEMADEPTASPPVTNGTASTKGEVIERSLQALQDRTRLLLERVYPLPAAQSMTPAAYAELCETFFSRAVAIFKDWENIAPIVRARGTSLETTILLLRQVEKDLLAMENRIPLEAPVAMPQGLSMRDRLTVDRRLQIDTVTPYFAIQVLNSVPAKEYRRVNSLLELALTAPDKLVYQRLTDIIVALSNHGNEGYLVVFLDSLSHRTTQFYPYSLTMDLKGKIFPWVHDTPKGGQALVTDLRSLDIPTAREHLTDPKHYFRNKLEYAFNLLGDLAQEHDIDFETLLHSNPLANDDGPWEKFREIVLNKTNLISVFRERLLQHPLREFLASEWMRSVTATHPDFPLKPYDDDALNLSRIYLNLPNSFPKLVDRYPHTDLLGPLLDLRSISEVISGTTYEAEETQRMVQALKMLSSTDPDSQWVMPDQWRDNLRQASILSTPRASFLLLDPSSRRKAEDYVTASKRRRTSWEDRLTGNRIVLKDSGHGYRLAPVSEAGDSWHRELIRRIEMIETFSPAFFKDVCLVLFADHPEAVEMAPGLVGSIMKHAEDTNLPAESVETQLALWLTLELSTLEKLKKEIEDSMSQQQTGNRR